MRHVKTVFWVGIFGLALFEFANIYFIMPMPGSQETDRIELSYFLYSFRWLFRISFALMTVQGLYFGNWKKPLLPFFVIVSLAVISYLLNYRMSADHMFLEPSRLIMAKAQDNKVEPERLVIGVEVNGEARAYPIRFIGYHHQVRDTVGGSPAMITYCTVCRTGRVYAPLVDGRPESFRLVGMDRYNALFEDATTGSWWRQATGEAVAGKLKGSVLPEILSRQLTLEAWLKLYPDSRIMQADPSFIGSYDTTLKYEKGLSRKRLTGTDSLSWQKKSWVVGVKLNGFSRAYDWNRLKKDRFIEDTLAGRSIFIVLAQDDASFSAFERTGPGDALSIKNDTIILGDRHFRFDGKGLDTIGQLKKLSAYQEFWHSWESFNTPDKRP